MVDKFKVYVKFQINMKPILLINLSYTQRLYIQFRNLANEGSIKNILNNEI